MRPRARRNIAALLEFGALAFLSYAGLSLADKYFGSVTSYLLAGSLIVVYALSILRRH